MGISETLAVGAPVGNKVGFGSVVGAGSGSAVAVRVAAGCRVDVADGASGVIVPGAQAVTMAVRNSPAQSTL